MPRFANVWESPASQRRRLARSVRKPWGGRHLRLEALEPRQLLATAPLASIPTAQFLVDSANYGVYSHNPSDAGQPIIPLYSEYNAGGDYYDVAGSVGMTLDANTQWEPSGAAQNLTHTRTVLKATALSGSGVLHFNLSTVGLRAINQFGFTHSLRFWIQPDTAGQEVMVRLYRKTTDGAIQEVTAARTLVRMLTTGWQEREAMIPGMWPSNLVAIDFVLGDGRNSGKGTFWLDDVRLQTKGFDPSRAIQSYEPRFWVASPVAGRTDTVAWRDLNLYSNHSYLEDNSLAIKAMLSTGDATAAQTAEQLADGVLRTGNADGSFYDELSSGHAPGRVPLAEKRTLRQNAWFGLALMDLYRVTGYSGYLSRARLISDWAETYLKWSGAGGGYKGGWGVVGRDLTGKDIYSYLNWQSTADNAVLFALNWQLADALVPDSLTDPASYLARAYYAGDFAMSAFDPAEGKFWSGTRLVENIDQETVTPVLTEDSVPLDAQTLTTLALPLAPRYRDYVFADGTSMDWRVPLAWAETTLGAVDTRYDPADPYEGFAYSTLSQPVGAVWTEGTAQASQAYVALAALYPAEDALYRQKHAETWANVDEIRRTHPNGDGAGVVVSTRNSLRDPYLAALYDGRLQTVAGALYDARLHAGTTAWDLLAQESVNPLAVTVLNSHRPLTDGTLSTNYLANDATSILYVWKVNGAVVQTTTRTPTIPATVPPLSDTFDLTPPGHGDRGDLITVEAAVTGGVMDGKTFADSALVANSPPAVTLSLDASSTTTAAVLTATATKSDGDGDPVSLTFVWKVNGTVQRTFTSATALVDTFDLSPPGHGDAGDTVTVAVTGDDGLDTGVAATATATVTADPLQLQPITDQTVPAGQQQSVTMQVLNAGAGTKVSFTATVLGTSPMATAAYRWDRDLNLTYAGSYLLNLRGSQEKWMLGKCGVWYFILPNGELHRWNGAATASGPLLATFAPGYYTQPGLLHDAEEAWNLDQRLGLQVDPDRPDNSGGRQEKWLLGNNNRHYFIRPNGMIYRFTGKMACSPLIAILSPAYWSDPTLLADPLAAATVQAAGATLTIRPRPGFVGEFDVRVTASDGTASDSTQFHVTVSAAAPRVASAPQAIAALPIATPEAVTATASALATTAASPTTDAASPTTGLPVQAAGTLLQATEGGKARETLWAAAYDAALAATTTVQRKTAWAAHVDWLYVV